MDIETLIARGLQILLALGGAYLLATWFVLAVWTFRDIESRSRSVVSQVFSTLLVVMFWVPGWLLYRLLRPNETIDEAYQRSLEEEYLLQDLQELPLCPSCNHFVEDDWRLCPHCNAELREDCSNCGRLIDLKWDVCPYCATPHHHTHEREDVQMDDDRWIDPSVIEKRLRDEEADDVIEGPRALPAETAATTMGREAFGPQIRSTEDDASRTAATVANRKKREASEDPDLSVLGDSDDTSEEEIDSTKIPERYRITVRD